MKNIAFIKGRITASPEELPARETFLRRGGLWVVGQSVLLTMVAFLSVYYREQFSPFRYHFLMAGVIFGLSALAGIAGSIELGKNRTAFPIPLPNSHFVSTGIYHTIRHPLYLSLMLFAISWPLFWGSAVGLASAPLVILFFDLKARCEERWLRQKHSEYAEYAQLVPRFVPFIY